MISSQYAQAQTHMLHVQHRMQNLAYNQGFEGTSDLYDNKFAELEADINTLRRTISQVEYLAQQEIQRKDLWASRIGTLQSDLDSINRAFAEALKRRQMRASQGSSRAALMNGVGNRTSAYEMDTYEEQSSMHRSAKMLDDQIRMGRDALRDLQEQRDKLKGAKRKLLDIANSLGVSRSVLTVIERAEFRSKLTGYVGLVVVLVIILLFYYFLHSRSDS